MHLEYSFNLLAMLKPPVDVGDGPFGRRQFFEVAPGGRVEGARLNGDILTGGGDWLLAGVDGFARLDVRAQIRTHDGAFIYIYYTGLLELNNKVAKAAETGTGTDYGDQYFRTAPCFETGDARYAWLNQSLFVGEGRLRPSAVEYKAYRIA